MEIVFVLLVLVGVSTVAGGSEQVHKRITNSRFRTVKRESPETGVDVYAGYKNSFLFIIPMFLSREEGGAS